MSGGKEGDRSFSYRRGEPLLFCFCGPAGSGKSSICKEVMWRLPQVLLSISTTTRAPRKSEKDGREYSFVDREEFQRRLSKGLFVEHAEYGGNMYGTEHSNVTQAKEAGADLLLDIDIEGVRQLRVIFPEQVRVLFIIPPSLRELEIRLRGRRSETEEAIARRLDRALREIAVLETPGFANYRIINEQLANAVEDAVAVVRAERLRTK